MGGWMLVRGFAVKLLRIGLIWSLVISVANSCSPVNETNSKSTANQPSETSRPTTGSDDAQRLALPSWCAISETSDKVCFRCDREDAKVSIPYEQCLVPGPSFSSANDCIFTNGLTKSITCGGTKSGEPFKMDASLAKEKLAAALPAFLIGLDLVVRQKFPDDSEVAKLTSDLSAFWSSRIPSIMRGENLDLTGTDLVLLANRHLKTKLSDEQATHLKQITTIALTELNEQLAGQKDYRLSQVLLRGLSIAKSIPDSMLGEAAPYLTGKSLASLLSDDKAQSLITMFQGMNPSVLGISSVKDLIADLDKAN